MRKLCMVSEHRPLVTLLSKYVATLSQQLQYIMPQTHYYRVHNIYRPGPELYIADWLSYNNHKENWDLEIAGMSVNVNAISTSVNIPLHMSIEDIHTTLHEDTHLQELKAYTIQGWPPQRDEVEHRMKPYWPIRDQLTMIHGISNERQQNKISFSITGANTAAAARQANENGKQETTSVWIRIPPNYEDRYREYSETMYNMATLPPHTATWKNYTPWTTKQALEIVIFSINNNTLLCIVDHYSKYQSMKRPDGLSSNDLIRGAKIVFAKFRQPKEIVSDASTYSYHTDLNNSASSWTLTIP